MRLGAGLLTRCTEGSQLFSAAVWLSAFSWHSLCWGQLMQNGTMPLMVTSRNSLTKSASPLPDARGRSTVCARQTIPAAQGQKVLA